MSFLNSALRGLFDVLLYPFQGFHYLVGLGVVSVLFGILALIVYKHTSNQEGIGATKQKIYASLFEIRLYNDDLGAISRAMGGILRHNVKYLGLNLVPILWLIVPFALTAFQLDAYYGYVGLETDDSTVVVVELKDGWQQSVGLAADGVRPAVSLEIPEGLRLDSQEVWAPSTRELAWRLRAEAPGRYEIGVDLGGQLETKSLVVTDRVVRRSNVRPGSGEILDQLLYPSESAVAESSPVQRIAVAYPERGSWAPPGLAMAEGPTWVWWFLVLSVAAGFALKDVFGVTL